MQVYGVIFEDDVPDDVSQKDIVRLSIQSTSRFKKSLRAFIKRKGLEGEFGRIGNGKKSVLNYVRVEATFKGIEQIRKMKSVVNILER